MLPPRALATVHVMVSTYGENEDEEECLVILATSIWDWWRCWPDGELGVKVENDENEEYDFLVDCLGISCDFRSVHNVFHI